MTAKKAKTEMDPLTEKPEPFMGDAEGTGQPPAFGDNARGCPVMGRRVLELKVQWARPGEAFCISGGSIRNDIGIPYSTPPTVKIGNSEQPC